MKRIADDAGRGVLGIADLASFVDVFVGQSDDGRRRNHFLHDFKNGWKLEIGGLYQNAVRNLYGISNNFGNYTTTKNFAAIPRYTILSNDAALNGSVYVLGLKNDLTLATNGFVWRSLSYRNGTTPAPGSTSFTPILGSANIADPVVYAPKPAGANGGEYESGYVSNQSIIGGDTIHLTNRLAVQNVLNVSFLKSRGFAANTTTGLGQQVSKDTESGALSPNESVSYKLTPTLTPYFTYARSIEQGDTAPTNAVNANQILAPYHDLLLEAGAKYAVAADFLASLAFFRMTRPYATSLTNRSPFAVIGDQRNYGVELFGQGSLSPDLSVIGGVTWLDPRLQDSGTPATNNKLIVGTPHWKSDLQADYHPFVFHGFALTGAIHYQSARAATDTNNSFAPAFATLELGVRYSRTYAGRSATFRFQVLNVANKNYYSSIADGNSIVGSAGANTAYSGAPRVFQASLEVDL